MAIHEISSVYTPSMAKVLFSLPSDLLADIDREAANRGMSRSAFLRKAVTHELGWRDPEEIEAALAAGRAALAGLGPFDSTELVAAEKRARDERDRRRFG
jgi:Arc/MetJ-type ribon-helix-helix transcriptional regulator